ncbi:glycosyltransferase family 32 protein [uncultured Vibrio sp.]|uniref:glycosyltransferase family 32 protein n=1 Tax=uncultured Vibrio sp. TaxID=114054 RepID=UPI0025CC8BAA|nr:glycosyltransferase [uncultured Vibrio sp.]
MNNIVTLISNRLIRLTGNVFKLLSYPFHFVFRNKRFTIPEYSPAKIKSKASAKVPRIIWQTNYSNKSALPVYLNYLFNRLCSLNYDYYYVSTEAREKYLKQHAPKELFAAYEMLTDGAAQADVWRVFVLYQQGGVYMDIDATLVWNLDTLIGTDNDSLYIKVSHNTEITNYFIATEPNNTDLKECLNLIIHNINNYEPEMGVYHSTGPTVLNNVLSNKNINAKDRKYVCIQGTFTNEYFQYLDKPRGKWVHMDTKDLVKKRND